MYFTLSPDGTVVSVNRYGAAQLGYTTDELIGQSVLSVFDPLDHQTVLAQLQQCTCNPHQTFEWEIQKLRKDGTRLWVHERARMIADGEGAPTVLIVCENVTEHRKTTQLLATLVRESPLPIVGLDANARVMSWNQAATQLFGWTKEEVLGRELPYVPTGQGTAADALWEQGTRNAVQGPIELRRCRKDGTLLDLLLWPVFVYGEGGNLATAIGIYVDRSDLKRAEEALRKSEARLTRFVADAPVGLVILGQDKRVICANKALCELTGYSEQEILGNTYELYTHPDDLPANLALTDDFFRGVRSEYNYEKRYIRKSGEIIWVSVKATRVELPGHSGPLLLAAVQDITERKLAAEERERLSQDLHDNILQSLYAVGMQLEAGKIAMGRAPTRSKAHMTQAIDHLNHLMLDIRQYITLLTQRTLPKPDFGQALRLLVASLSATGRAAPELLIEDPVLSLINPVQGEQLLNIAREALSNSMRHAQATHRSVQLSSKNRAIRLVICDDGVGFSLRRRRLRGHGLANMDARAKSIRARLTFHSAPGKGTRVTVEVPVEKGAADA
jgi:PAS domain S-box-containing protein